MNSKFWIVFSTDLKLFASVPDKNLNVNPTDL